ncbi:peptidoglycan DD-metalloendopeptidase family protein [Sporolactobacillus shoreicorticis]|uniref:Murein hydrolase activator EnvC family protein n=1 Tax=Sporolactobacillus shoreicorticis TaxID=1923877 RepID=A0ABW5S1T1_9BACL|nr:peptidoglycan DD-metalloendopeptidase family protein [Sporolactobacillus shoreicorticis]MCO7125328.1 peptidoglycan DD-metalloendopeptidase family protein [Sporolactobacillus shoreicorticis]
MDRKYIHKALALGLMVSLIMGYIAPEAHAAQNQRFSENQQQQDVVIKQLKSLDHQVKKIKAALDAKRDQLAENREKSKWMKEEIERLDKQIDSRDKLMKERIRIMYVNEGSANYLDVLLGSENFGNFIDRLFALKTISENDRNMLNDQKNDKANRSANQQALIKEQSQLKNGLEELKDLRTELLKKEEEQRSQLALLKKEAEKIKEKEMDEDERREVAKAQMHTINDENLSDSDAAFIKPAQGYISSGFGKRSFDNNFHPGIDIANSEGTPVKAAADGVVFRAYQSPSYGNTVMISHKFNGKLFTTVYAHLSSYQVATGARVTKGQVIGKMGNTGESFGSHLHFELYDGQWNPPPHNGAVDPMKYIQ